MEFKYTTKSIVLRSIHMLFFAILILAIIVYSLLYLTSVDLDIIIMIIIFLFLSRTLYKHFQKFRTVITVNDQEICIKNNKVISIRWEEVVLIDNNIWKLPHLFNPKRIFLMVFPSDFMITINSNKQKIVIDSYIQNVNKLIKFMKEKANNKFDTKSILYKYKT